VGFSGLPLDQYYVSFDPEYEFGASILYRGTFVPNPDLYEYPYAGPSARDPHDIAIVRLAEPVPVTPARLPSADLVSSLDLGKAALHGGGLRQDQDR
jgi:hypothetical protein